MEFTRKARWMKDGHRTADPLETSYDGVASRNSVQISYTLAAINGLDIFALQIFRTPIFKLQHQRSTMLSIDLNLENIKERRL